MTSIMSSVCLFSVCLGTSDGMTHRGQNNHRYAEYKKRYTNCTYVDGNLEIVFLDDEFDLSFLKDIQEVTGYVLLVANYASSIPLTSLRIIRGRTLYQHKENYYSLFVALNFKPPNDRPGYVEVMTPPPQSEGPSEIPTIGLRELSLTSLYGQ